jgi:hypothetical protein
MAEETKDTRRKFLGPDAETYFYIGIPTAQDIRAADWHYSKTYTNSLVEGITTSAEMMDILRRRGIIGPEFEQRAAELAGELNQRLIQLDEAETIEEKRELAVDVANAREELFQWNQRLNGPLSNTCEQIADDARLEHLTSSMIQKEDGTRVWESYDHFLKEKSQGLALKARFEVMLFLQGLDSDFLEQTPEAQAMKEVEKDVLAKAEEAVKAIQALDEEAAKEEAKIEEQAEKSKPKPAARKKTALKKKAPAKKAAPKDTE